MRDNSGWFCIPVLAWHRMPPSEHPHRPVWPGGAAYLGTFLLIPLWDVWALAHAIRHARRTGAGSPHPLLAFILSEPIRRLLVLAAAYGFAWAGLGTLSRLIARLGPFGVLATGLSNLPRLADGPCCDASTVIRPGAPLGEMLAARLPLTLGVLAAAFVSAGVLTALLLGVSLAARRWPAGVRLAGWLAAAPLAAPVGVVALLVMLVPGVRLGLLPADGARAPLYVAAAGVVAALLPALLSARAGLREVDSPGGPWFAAARAFSEQSGWLISSLIAVEVGFALDGIGALLVEGLAWGDAPATIRAVQALAPLLLVLRLRAEINQAAARALAVDAHPAPEPASPAPPLRRARLALALLAILLPLAVAVGWLPHRQAAPDPGALYQRPSEAHPLGTDHLGRDVRGQVSDAVLSAWGTALTGAVVALGFGGLWAAAASAVRGRGGRAATLLADVLLLPAEAAILAHAPLVVLLLQGAGPAPGVSAVWLGVATGLVLVPRAARAASGESNAADWLSLAALFALAVLLMMEYSQIIHFLLPGGLLARHRELIVGARLAPGGPYLRLGAVLSLPGIATALGAYLLQDALAPRERGLTLLN